MPKKISTAIQENSAYIVPIFILLAHIVLNLRLRFIALRPLPQAKCSTL